MPTVGIVSPGAMGSAVGNALARGGLRVVCTLSNRSERTARLAEKANVEVLSDLGAVVRNSDLVLSIVPPEAAEAVAADLASAARTAGVTPLIADLNATAPATVERIEMSVGDADCDFVDGSISGPPPWRAGTTRIYLAGRRAAEVAQLGFEGLELVVVGDRAGPASAVKMSTASVYKGTTAVLAQALRAADANGVLEHVIYDLRAGAPELAEDVERRLARATAKSARYVGEMHEIASTQSAAGLTPALFEAMAEIYESLARTPAARTAPEDISPSASLQEILAELRATDSSRP